MNAYRLTPLDPPKEQTFCPLCMNPCEEDDRGMGTCRVCHEHVALVTEDELPDGDPTAEAIAGVTL